MSRREEIRELYEGGVCQEQIAKRMQISPSTVSYHMRSLGYPAKPHKRYDWKAVQTFYDEGNSVRQCAAHFGFSLSAWGDAVNRRAVKARPRAMSVERLLGGRRSRHHLMGRLLKLGLKESRCEHCGIEDWRGRPLSLELHHINGQGQDNRLENLALLCPNCHSQTDTWGGRNTRRTNGANGSAPIATPPPALPSRGTG